MEQLTIDTYARIRYRLLTRKAENHCTEYCWNEAPSHHRSPLSLIAVEPALAQQTSQSAVCSADNLPGMIEGFFQLTTGLGIVGLAVVWQADSLIEMFTLNPDQKKGLKRHKRSAMKSAVVLVILGPLYTVAGSMMGLPLAQCVDLVPW